MDVNVHVGSDGNTVTFARIDLAGSLAVDSVENLADFEPNSYLLVDSTIGVDVELNLGARAGTIVVNKTMIGRNLELNNATFNVAPITYVSHQGVYAAMRITDTIVSGSINASTSANTLIRADNIFTGGAYRVWGHTSANAFQVYNSRAVGGIDLSTVTPTIPLHIGSTVSLYDSIELSGVIADGGLTSKTAGDVLIRYSRFEGNSIIDTYFGDDTVVVDTTEFNGALSVALGNGDNGLDFRNSVVNGTLRVAQGSNFQKINSAALHNNFQRTSTMHFTNNRIATFEIAGGSLTDEVRILNCDCGQITASLASGSDLFEIVGTTARQERRLTAGLISICLSAGTTISRGWSC